MLKRCLTVVLILVVACTSWAEDRRQDKARLKIMTFNGEFVWDGKSPEEGQADFPWKGSPEDAEEHMRLVAEVIARGNADIVNMVEVENLDALTKLNDSFLAGRGYKPYLVKGTDTTTGQDVGLLTRIDPISFERDARAGTAGTITKSVSKNYVAKFELGTTRLALVGVHLLAFPLREDRISQRMAQADAVRRMAGDLAGAGFQVVVLGDFNDYESDPEALDHQDNRPGSEVLAMIRGLATASAADDLVNAARFVPKGLRYTAHYDANDNGRIDFPRELTSIDHVLLAPALAAKVTAVEIPHDHNPLEVSDHFPIVVHLQLAEESGGRVRIARLLANPEGDDTAGETVTLKNTTSASVSVQGWKLRDKAGGTWTLTGSLAAGAELVVQRNGQAMSLNNTGDIVELRDGSDSVVDVRIYGAVHEGEELSFAE